MIVSVVGVKDHKSPTTVGYGFVAPTPTQSLHIISKAWGIRPGPHGSNHFSKKAIMSSSLYDPLGPVTTDTLNGKFRLST